MKSGAVIGQVTRQELQNSGTGQLREPQLNRNLWEHDNKRSRSGHFMTGNTDSDGQQSQQ